MKQRVIVIGQSYTSRLCVIRSVAQMGCEVYVIVMTGYKKDGKTLDTRKNIDCYSKHVNKIFYCAGNDGHSLINILLTQCITEANNKPIIISVGDFVTTVIDMNLNQLKEHFLFSHINYQQGAIVEWMNKEQQKSLAKKIGLNITNSTIIEIKDGCYSIPADISYPCFTKTRAYIRGCKHTLKRCNTESELNDFVRDLGTKFNLTLLVEDYKDIEKEYAVVGFSDGINVVIPGIIQIEELAHGSHFGVACRGVVIPIDGFEELVSKFKEFVLNIGYVGLFDIDFYRSDGKFYFGELNLRIGGSGYAITKMGVNLPAMFVKSLLNIPIDDMPQTIKKSATFVNERMWIDDWFGKFISTKECYKYLVKSDISFVRDSEDTGPHNVLYRMLMLSLIRKIVKKILGKE